MIRRRASTATCRANGVSSSVGGSASASAARSRSTCVRRRSERLLRCALSALFHVERRFIATSSSRGAAVTHRSRRRDVECRLGGGVPRGTSGRMSCSSSGAPPAQAEGVRRAFEGLVVGSNRPSRPALPRRPPSYGSAAGGPKALSGAVVSRETSVTEVHAKPHPPRVARHVRRFPGGEASPAADSGRPAKPLSAVSRWVRRPRLAANPAPMEPVQTSTPVTSFSFAEGRSPRRAPTVSGSGAAS